MMDAIMPSREALVQSITRRYEFDMGHRLASHPGKCHHLHGHRYVLEVTVSAGLDEQGMVMDFSALDEVVETTVIEPWDHRFLIAHDDPFVTVMATLSGVVSVPFIPTAENLARECWRRLTVALGPRVRVVLVKLNETANGWAEVS